MPSYSANFPAVPRTLSSACHEFGLVGRQESPLSADLVLFEAGEAGPASLNDREASVLIEHLRTGGRLLFSLSPFAGQSAFWLSAVLPSTGWTTQARPSIFKSKQAIRVTPEGEGFFRDRAIDGLGAPLGFDIRPMSAVERGQSRYERYDLRHPVTKKEVKAGTDLWSRSLLNREWTIRARYDDITAMPFLVTGRYGAGRIAMLATNVAAVGESMQAAAFWSSVVEWLVAPDEASDQLSPSSRPTLEIEFPHSGFAQIRISHGEDKPLKAQLVVRSLDGSGAMLPDGNGEFQHQLTLQPKQETIVDLRLPNLLSAGFESLQAESALEIRAGLLSGDGSALLAEKRIATPLPDVSLKVKTDNLYAISYPFHAPGPEALTGFRGRMGLFTGAYTYRPGSFLSGNATVSFASRNVALTAEIHDLTQLNNESVMALNDKAAGLRQVPSPEGIRAYGTWNGKAGSENVLQFDVQSRTEFVAVTLVGSFGPFANAALHNPGKVIIEVDGRSVVAVEDLDASFLSGFGQARIQIPNGVVGKRVTIRFPWVALHRSDSRPRLAPWLGEVLLEGTSEYFSPQVLLKGRLSLHLVNALTGARELMFAGELKLDAGESHHQPYSVALPSGRALEILRVEASFESDSLEVLTAEAPVLVVNPVDTIKPFTDLSPPDIFGTALVVTGGFTQFSSVGTGTRETWNGWGHPDDLVWAYSRQLKEIPRNARTAANRLYATETDMRHYSTPWREYPNGELFFPTSINGLINHLSTRTGWATTSRVRLNFADRWVVGPDLNYCNSWQEYVAFDSHLRNTSGSGLTGITHGDIEASIHRDHESQWQAWQLERYVRSVRAIRKAFQDVNKDVFIYSQGFPMVAGEAGRELARTIRGMNDDFTWGMQDNSPTLTIGRNLGEVAFNPVWETTSMMPWGFVSPVFNNWQWHTPVGTTEPNRRLLYNRLWRGMIWDGGRFRGIFTYGYTVNVGTPYTMTEEEYQQWWYLQERGSLLQPEAPLGAGLVISTQKNLDPRSVRFNCDDATSMDEPRLLMRAFHSLHEAGLSLPFAANAASLRDWVPSPGASLVILNLQDFSEEEIQSLSALQGKGVPLVAFTGKSTLSPSAAAIFAKPLTLIVEEDPQDLTHLQAVEIAQRICSVVNIPIRFSHGIAGYGFRCLQTTFIVVEDWLEEARTTKIQLRKSSGALHAVAANLNDHSSLNVIGTRDFWEIAVPIRSADGTLVAVQER